MASPPGSAQGAGSAARTGVVGAIVAALAFFDGVFLGAPIALLAASLRPVIVFVVAAIAVSLITIGCCRWLNRRWDDWFAGNGGRIEKRLEAMRESRLMRHPVEWIQPGSDRWYAFASAVANPILVVGLSRSIGGNPVSERRILLGCVAYAVPYVALWTVVGLGLGDLIRAA